MPPSLGPRRREGGGGVKLWPVTLYRALDELEGEGLIQEVTEPDEQPGPGGRHRFFRLTEGGRAALEGEARRLKGVAGVALDRLEAREART